MSAECNHDCSSCKSKCENQSLIEKPHEMSKIKKVIGVVSGKGGVGKSLVTSLMAAKMQKLGYNAAILDADITGPSIPKVFGIEGRAKGNEYGILPSVSKNGTQVMSINLLLKETTDPVVWRGPVIAGTVKQFWTDVVWEDVDYMFVDMPPGTGDVPLTVFQSLPVDGIIVVTSPQELVSIIVEKAVKMAGMVNIPILALVENMSYFQCPDCGGRHNIFGESHIEENAEKFGIDMVAQIPMDPSLAKACDKGEIELFESTWLDDVANKLTKL